MSQAKPGQSKGKTVKIKLQNQDIYKIWIIVNYFIAANDAIIENVR